MKYENFWDEIDATPIKKNQRIKWNLEYHQYANIFPMLTQSELKQLADDIKLNKLQEPIMLYEGKILDGRNRYEACKLVGIVPQYKEYDQTIDPLNYVISINIKRRHLDAGQRAMIAVELANMKQGERTDLEPSVNSPKVSQTKAAKMLNVGESAVRQAKQLKEKHPEKAKEVKEGTTKLHAAVKQTKKEDHIKQRTEAVKKIPENKSLYLGNCVEVLATLPTNSVDCVVMDPPYAINYKDTRESFNPEFEDDPEVILPMLRECFKELKRVCKKDAHIYCFFGMSEYITFYNILFEAFEGQVDKIPLIWVKNNHTMCDFSTKYALKYEPIFFISNKERKLNNPVSPDVLTYNIPTNKLHKTQKPLDLCEYLIKNSTIEGEVVLDPFMGSGTTCLAAKNNNRKYIGIEKNEDIFNIAKERLENALEK